MYGIYIYMVTFIINTPQVLLASIYHTYGSVMDYVTSYCKKLLIPDGIQNRVAPGLGSQVLYGNYYAWCKRKGHLERKRCETLAKLLRMLMDVDGC